MNSHLFQKTFLPGSSELSPGGDGVKELVLFPFRYNSPLGKWNFRFVDGLFCPFIPGSSQTDQFCCFLRMAPFGSGPDDNSGLSGPDMREPDLPWKFLLVKSDRQLNSIDCPEFSLEISDHMLVISNIDS